MTHNGNKLAFGFTILSNR